MADTVTALTNSTSVSAFYYDPVFTNRYGASHAILGTGGICKLSQKGLSYFSQPTIIDSPQTAGQRNVAWSSETVPSLIVDNASFAQFITDLGNMSATLKQTTYQILDQIFFNNKSLSDLETILTSTDPYDTIYLPGSLTSTGAVKTATYYTATLNGSVTVWPYVSFSLVYPYPSAQAPTQYDFVIYTNDPDWVARYPISIVEAVLPPIPYQDLLTASLSTTTVNEIALAKEISALAYSTIGTAENNQTNSGYVIYNSTIVDLSDSSLVQSVPFTVVYKGAQPSISVMRAAVKNAVLASGVGSQALWQVRLPDLFISQRFFLVALWDATTQQSDRILYQGIVSPASVIPKLALLFPNATHALLQSSMEEFQVYYNDLQIVSIPDQNASVVTTLLSLLPTYQSTATTDPSFLYMDSTAQTFAKTLNTVLATASGAVTNSNLTTTTDQGLVYYPFTINEVEYCVITQANYQSILSAAQSNA